MLSLTLAGGGEVSLFVKHLGPEEADNPDKQCRDREVRVYEELLAGADLPVARYYGSAWNEATGRREVFLEYVDDWSLKYQPLEHWFTAARRLAGLHAHFAARAGELLACDFLLRLDAGYLHAWAERALATVRDLYPELAAGLEPVVRGYARVADVLGRQPLTLVHNDLSPKNVLADRSSSPARICFVDWELAGVGCGLLDLVHLKYGLGPEDDRRMCAAYRAELAGTGLLPADPREWDALLAACELHKTVYRLALLPGLGAAGGPGRGLGRRGPGVPVPGLKEGNADEDPARGDDLPAPLLARQRLEPAALRAGLPRAGPRRLLPGGGRAPGVRRPPRPALCRSSTAPTASTSAPTMDAFGFTGRACQIYNRGEATFGLSLPAVAALAREADLLLNISGHVRTAAVLDNVRLRVYLDQDPVYTQLWHAEYGKEFNFTGHDVYFTVGLNIGTPHTDIAIRTVEATT